MPEMTYRHTRGQYHILWESNRLTFYKTLFARMNNVAAGNFIDEETGESLNDVETVLNELGIELRDVNGEFRNSGEVLDEVAERWNTFDISVVSAGEFFFNLICLYRLPFASNLVLDVLGAILIKVDFCDVVEQRADDD